MTASYTVVPGANTVQLSTALLTATPPQSSNSPIVGRFLSFQADAGNTGVLCFGGSNQGSGTSTTNYGFRIEIPVTTIPAAPIEFEFATGVVGVDEFWIKASVNTDKVHVFIKD